MAVRTDGSATVASSAAKYTIDGGAEGKERLDLLARVHGPQTEALLDRMSIRGGARCVDLGCGAGHVSRMLARRVGEHGFVLAIDKDETVVELARRETDEEGISNIEFRCEDATRFTGSAFDVAYARCLLSHLADPAAIVEAMAGSLAPGGALVVEDIDFSAAFCHPPSTAYERYVALYRDTVRRRGGDPDIGPRLPSLLIAAGLDRVDAAAYQPCSLLGPSKELNVVTIQRIADAVVSEGIATKDEINEIETELIAQSADPTTVMSGPRVVQTWGLRR